MQFHLFEWKYNTRIFSFNYIMNLVNVTECYPEWKDRMEQKILQGFLLPATSSLMYELAKFPRD